MPERIQLRRVAGWRKPEGAIVVARPSKWGNPWTVGPGFKFSVCGPRIGDLLLGHGAFTTIIRIGDYPDRLSAHKAAVETYRALLAALQPDLSPLRGHDLACWCPADLPCHADVLLEVANA